MNAEFLSWEDAVLWLREQPDQQELVRACYFDDPLQEVAERYHASAEWTAVRGLLRQSTPGSALDLGAGRGISSYALARDGWQVTALEPDPSDVVGAGAIRSLAAATGLEIQVVESFGESLPFPDASFDLVHARQVLHHARDLRGLCRELARVLRPGGLFLATREHVAENAAELARFLAEHPLHQLYGGENAYPLREYRRAITGAGLELRLVLGPYDSDLNLFPSTRAELRRQIEARLHLPIPEPFFTKRVIPLLTRVRKIPGRLYSFVGYRS